MLRNTLLILVFAALNLVPSPAIASDNCLTGTCHSKVVSVIRPHAPVEEGKCLSCHRQEVQEHPTPGNKGFTMIAKGGKLCVMCHESPGKGDVVHQPALDGNCAACHHPHGANGRFLLEISEERLKKADDILANGDDQRGLCLTCHDNKPFKGIHVHSPVGNGNCSLCHNPHRSPEKHLLNGPENSLCLDCHEDIKASLSPGSYLHPPLRVSGCTSCHDPHSSNLQYLLKIKLPDLCFDCHKTLQDQLSKVKKLHKPLTQERGCGNCHAPHASKVKKLLPFAEMDLCLNCHGDKTLAPLKDIRSELKGKKYVHGPIGTGQCTACHDPHGNDNFRMLKGPYPATLYAPYSQGTYDFCLRCHEKNLLRFAETTVFTKFRNGNRNLHSVHVANSRKGRSCRFCHEPHASDGPKLTSTEGARFGSWKIPFRLELTTSGGRCSSGCHVSLGYDRLKPVVYVSNKSPGFTGISSSKQGEPYK